MIGVEQRTGARESRPGEAIHPWWFKTARAMHELPLWTEYVLASGMVLLSLFARNALIGDREAYHLYVFFMPAILLASMVLRHGGGILAVLLSAVLIKAFYIPPLWSGWVNDPDDAVAIAVFIGSGLVTAVMGSALHRILFRLAKANDQIAAAERQNALLLDELTHRFKNDLANLTAILRLHAKEVADPQARNELIIASERVNVLSRVHERLTGSPKDTLVNVGEFLMELCRDLRVTAIGMRPVTLRTDLDSLELPFEAAISLGLIVNELVQNAIKYAFPGDSAGVIEVTLRRIGPDLRLRVSDDGIGAPVARPGGKSGLGQRVVASFAQQLGGHMEVSTDRGYEATIRFPTPRPRGFSASNPTPDPKPLITRPKQEDPSKDSQRRLAATTSPG